MSEGDKTHTAVLLPAARVMLVTKDADSKAAFEALSQDWRFARVALSVVEGGVETAISIFGGSASPELVIIQTDAIDDAFCGQLETLAGVCAEGTAAIIIGTDNDVNLYRKLIGMGVSDYIVAPLQTEPLGNDIAATLIEKIGATGSRLIALMGAKGGVGTTVLTEILARGLSEKMDQKTFLLDAAGGWGTLSVGMGFDPATTLAEALRVALDGNEDSLTRMIFRANDKLSILSSGGDVMLEDAVQAEHYEAFLNHIMTTYPVVIVDLSMAPAALKQTVLRRAHKIVLVTAPLLPSVRAARTLLHEIKDLRGGDMEAVDLVLNMAGIAPKHEVAKAQIEEGLDRKVSLVIDFDPVSFISQESEARKLSEGKETADVARKLMGLVQKILAMPDAGGAAANDDEGKKGGIAGFLNKLKTRA